MPAARQHSEEGSGTELPPTELPPTDMTNAPPVPVPGSSASFVLRTPPVPPVVPLKFDLQTNELLTGRVAGEPF